MTVMSKSKTAAKRESRVAEILDCAEIHFVEKGFHGAGISGIAKECGISVGHLYHYFASKDLLISLWFRSTRQEGHHLQESS